MRPIRAWLLGSEDNESALPVLRRSNRTARLLFSLGQE